MQPDAATIRVSRPHGGFGAEPITIGVPLGRSLCRDAERLRLWDGDAQVPLQASVLERWPDGSIRWVLLDFQCGPAEGSQPFALTWNGGPEVRARHAISLQPGPGGTMRVDTGRASFTMALDGSFPFERVEVGGRDVLDCRRSALLVEDARGRQYTPHIDSIEMEESGPLRLVALLRGTVARGRHTLLDIECRLHFFAGIPSVRVALTLRNPRRAKHPGGFWELGDRGSVFVKDAALSLALSASTEPARVACSREPGLPIDDAAGAVSVYQDSSGGENWASSTHVNRHGACPNTFRGYKAADGRSVQAGLRATPLAIVERGQAWAAATMPCFWQNFPKAIEADRDGVTLRLWPRQYADAHELQGGEQKTHVFYVSAGTGPCDSRALEWCRVPATASADPSWYCSSGVVDGLVPAAEDPNRDYLRLVQEAIDGPDSFAAKREAIDEYGWRHFGELYADHEGALHTGPSPLVSHYNNQYDGIAGFATHFLRTGDARYWSAMDELASHVADIDIYHTNRDKAQYNGGLFWHTYHYVDAARSTHRSYPRCKATNGGGPGNEHNYATGLMLHYYLTGNRISRDAVISLARWVVNMDDGRLTPFRWIAGGATGAASETDSPDYHGPGRGGAYSIQTLLDGFRLTGQSEFKDKAEQLIRRCVHPADDVDARGLLDVEVKWSYTVFLQALGRYLQFKRELGEFDFMYAYARASLVKYASWMLQHERPYLDKPEILEYPNETWIAQDMRKSEAFKYAAMHAGGVLRRRFLERSRFFFEYVVETLLASGHHTRTRPLVLMLTNGYREAAFGHEVPDYSDDAREFDFGVPESFVPQRAKVKRRLVPIHLFRKSNERAGLAGAVCPPAADRPA
jgi:hypothetical protein